MSNIGEESDSNLEHQKSARPARFTKVATYIGILGWLAMVIGLSLSQRLPAGGLESLSSEDLMTYWAIIIVQTFAGIISFSLVLVGLVLALIGTVRRERSRRVAAAWLVPASVVPFWLIVVLLVI